MLAGMPTLERRLPQELRSVQLGSPQRGPTTTRLRVRLLPLSALLLDQDCRRMPFGKGVIDEIQDKIANRLRFGPLLHLPRAISARHNPGCVTGLPMGLS